ncbi:glycosyl hydrolase family 18 protein [Caldalkalibacillus salinus]|uniref:glycosyl hydrolase family 18 protein n=1 Tax=Caldalkalibacillus salinus TaxID=2803787 RepID=UPI0019208279|nr:glycosyl hydrolase family 18 protein [Caldalkalibacillus salinus]
MQTENAYQPRHRTHRKQWYRWGIISFFLALIITFGVILLIFADRANQEQSNPYPEAVQTDGQGTLYPLIVNGDISTQHDVLVDNEEFFVPYELFLEHIDDTVSYDEASETFIFTANNEVVTLQSMYLTNELKDEQVTLNFPVRNIDGQSYIPFSPFEQVYPVEFKYYDESQIVELNTFNTPKMKAEVSIPADHQEDELPTTFIRTEPTYQAPYVTDIQHGTPVEMLEERENWYQVKSNEGWIGYIPKDEVTINGAEVEEWTKPERTYAPWNPIAGKINLTWEHVVSRNPDTDNIEPMNGVNVVSPTWFHLKDGTGGLKNLADKQYVSWAHGNGYQVWGLVTNDFNPDMTHELLSSYENRKNMINQLIYYSELYNLDGINVDFENVYLKDKENLVQFMRELTPYLHEMGLVVSIDVTIKSDSEMWSLFLDREKLAGIVDYMMVMTYDEHWGSSPVAGSVASLPWVERGLQGVLEEVPNEKLVLGVPFYTRIWAEEETADGSTNVSSRAFSMNGVNDWIEENNVQLTVDQSSGQYYGEYYDDEEQIRYRVWLEDEYSMAQRIELVHKYDLAGVASWRRGFEETQIWDVIQKGLEQRLNEQ